MIGQIPVELRQWLRDNFDLQQEILTSAITLSDVFDKPPGVVGQQWQHGTWQCHSDYVSSPRCNVPCLAVLNENTAGSLQATLAAFHQASQHTRIVLVLQEAATQPANSSRPWKPARSIAHWGSTSGTQCRHVDLAVFSPGTIMFDIR